MRAIIKYSRKGSAAYISHLDMQRAFARALRRAQLPVAFSEGFNPHIIMSFASPLSVGYLTKGDYLEVKFKEEIPTVYIMERLNAVLPEDICVLYCGELEEGAPKLMAVNSSALYEMEYDCDIEKAAQEFFAAESFVATDRKGREIDVRPMVLEGSAIGNRATVLVCNSSAKAMNPVILDKVFADGKPSKITRIETYANYKGAEIPFYEMGKVTRDD